MNLYINNIKITLLANAGSLNVGTTLNMVKSTSTRETERFKPRDVIPALRQPGVPEEIRKEAESLVPAVPTVQV